MLALLLASCLAVAPAAHAQIYVDRDASGANNGSSWSDAYTNLQTAIDNASGSDQIWIAEGTYKPTFERSGTVQFSYLAYRKRSFVIPDSKDGLKLYGGFDGSETALDQRDPGAHEVILSGDLGPGDDAPFDPDFDSDAKTNASGDIVDPVPETRSATDHLRAGLTSGPPELGWGANVNHVVFLGGGLSRSTVIDGITITGGFAVAQFVSTSTGDYVGGEQRNFGGGLFCDGCSATVRGVTFRGNYAAAQGGAVYVTGGGNPHFINSVFWGNNAGKRPPTFNDPPGDRVFQFYFVSGPGDTNGQPVTDQITDGFGTAVFNDGGSPDIDFSTFFQHPDPSDASTLENISGDDVLFADNDAVGNDLDLDPSSPTFLQIDTETSSLVDAGSTSRLPADTEDLDGDGDTSEPLPIDASGNERIQGVAPDPGAYESPFSTAPNPGPTAIAVGERLPIVGRGVDAATAVRINGTPATNLTGTGDGNQRITVTVPEGTTSGFIEIDTPGGTITTEESITIVDPPYGPGQALDAPGFVEISDPSAFTFPTPRTGSSGFTVSLWTKGSFLVQKEGEANGWELSGSPGGEARFLVRFEGEQDTGNTRRFGIAASIRLPDDGQWHHVAATYQFNDANEGTHITKVYVDGVKQRASRTGDDLRLTNTRRPSTNDTPAIIDAGGTLDQVRIYNRFLSESDLLTDNSTSDAVELDVRRRIHRTADLSDGQYSGLIAEYRFDSGDPDTVFDYAGRNSGTYQSGAGPVLSTAPVGQDAGSFPIGPDGASFVSQYSDNFGTEPDVALIGLYRYGAPDGTMRTSSDPGEAFDATLPGGLTERAALTWGGYKERTAIDAAGNITGQRNPGLTVLNDRATVVEYANVTNVAEPVGLLYRVGPGQPWRTADATKDPAAQTFRVELPEVASAPGGKATPPGEYAVASFPFSDLRLSLTPETQALAPGETATFTATLTNSGPDDVPGVTVDFDATALSGLTASGGTFSGSTWDIGTLAGGTSATLTLTAISEAGLSALRGELGLNDINNGNNAAQAVVKGSPAYGPGQALAFDGTDDHLRLRPDVRLDNRSFTISFWAKRASTGSEQIILSQGTGSGPGEALRIGFRSDDRFTVDVTGASVTTDTPITDTDWHHWVVVHDAHPLARDEGLAVVIYLDGQKVKEGVVPDFYRGGGDLLIGRSAQSGGQHFAGALDQLRIWNQELVVSDDNFDAANLIRDRMHQRLAPGDAKAEFLLASYRFDEGRGTVAHSAGQGPLATFEGNPQWVPFSAARLGEESAVATSSSNASIGPDGAQLSATDASGDVQLYRYGRADASLRTESDEGEDLSSLPTGITERSHQTWGVSVPGGTSPDATLTLDYNSAVGTATTPAAPVRLIRRDAPGEPWTVADDWIKDKAAQTFTSTGTVQTGEYALVTLPYADLAVSIDPPAPVASGEDAAFTVTLTNTGPDASVSAAVDLSTNATLGTPTPGTPSAGSVSGTTWMVGALASGASATLEVTAPFAGPEPGTLTATATDAESIDSQAGNDAGTATVITPPYGAETALDFDGTDDFLETVPVSQAVASGNGFSMSAWVRPSSGGSEKQTVMGFYTGSGNNRNIITYRTSAEAFYYFDNDVGEQLAAFTSAPDTWHHVAATVADDGSGAFYVNGREAATFSTPVRPVDTGQFVIGMDLDGSTPSDFLDGQLDQVRLWNAALTEAEVRARMHRTIAPTDAAFGDLIAGYRFDVGTGTTAYDYAGSNNAVFQGNPQWTAFSGASVGQTSAVATSSSNASIGPAGAQLSAVNVSADAVQLYRFGTADGPLRSGSDPGESFGGVSSERSNLTWGIATPTGTAPTADLTLDYSGVATLPNGDVTLVRRDRPGDPWTFASGWGHDKGNQRFLFSGPVPTGEYAIADVPPPQVTTNTGLTLDQGTFADITQAMLETSDPNDAPGTLEYTVTSGPTSGQLLVFGQPLGGGGPSGFTQRLINDGQVTYVSDGTAGTDTFDFTVTDGAETITGTFTITVGTNDVYEASGGFAVLGEGDSGPRPVGDTGLLLDLQTVPGFGSGFVHVVRYDDAPANAESIDLPNVGTSRYVITTLGRLQVDAGTAIQIAADLLPHPDPSSVTVYSRDAEGTGSFAPLATSYDPSADVVKTTVDSFSEFATAATDVFSVTVPGRDGLGNDTGFRMLSMPAAFARAALEDDLDFSVSDGALLQVFPGGGADGSDWVEVTDPAATVERGRGFILYFFDDSTDPLDANGIDLDIPDDGSVDPTADVTVPNLDLTDEYEVLGNPFAQAIPFDALGQTAANGGGSLVEAGFQSVAAVWDGAAQRYAFLLPGDPIPAFTGLVLQRSTVGAGDAALRFTAPPSEPSTDPATDSLSVPAATQDDAPGGRITLAVTASDATTNQTHRVRAVLRLHPEAAAGWDAVDFGALPPPQAGRYVRAAFPTLRGGALVERAVAGEPLEAGAAVDLSLPLSVRGVSVDGPAQVAWPEALRAQVPADWSVELVDRRPGDGPPVAHDMRTGPYAFDMEAASAVTAPEDARFRLRVTAAPLPVELAGFDATQSDAAVTLQWQTASETNNAGFQVERHVVTDSTAGFDPATASDWAALGFVEGAGTTTDVQRYRFQDERVPFEAEQIAYRLRQVDVDGTVTYSEARVLAAPRPAEVRLHAPFPNPARGQVTMRYELPEAAEVSIRVYDLLGRQVVTLAAGEQAAGRTEMQVPLQRLAPGPYFLRLQTGDTLITRRLTILR